MTVIINLKTKVKFNKMKIKGITGKLPNYLEYKGHAFQPQYNVRNGSIYECLGIVCQFDDELKNIRIFFTYYDPIDKYILSAPKELFEIVDETIPDFWMSSKLDGKNFLSLEDPDLLNHPYLEEELSDSDPNAVEVAKRIVRRHNSLW